MGIFAVLILGDLRAEATRVARSAVLRAKFRTEAGFRPTTDIYEHSNVTNRTALSAREPRPCDARNAVICRAQGPINRPALLRAARLDSEWGR